MGVVARPECAIQAQLATVEVLLLDGRDSIGPLLIHAMLADSNDVPLLLGAQGCLDRLKLFSCIAAGNAYFEA
jgi:hypothetical protein